MKTKKVLFPTDYSSTASRALPLAIECAERSDAELHILHAIVLHESDPLAAKEGFEETEKLVQDAEIRVVRAHVRGFSTAAVIVRYALEHETDFIVMGTHGRSATGRFFLGSVAEDVVREASCPVFAVRREDEGTRLDDMSPLLPPASKADRPSGNPDVLV